jgi:hypothetical protein
MRDNVEAECPEGNVSLYHHVAPTFRRDFSCSDFLKAMHI